MTRQRFIELHRLARLGNLGTLTAMAGDFYYWFLEQVYDLRFPHVGDDRRRIDGIRTFDTLRHSTKSRLAWKRQAAYAAGIKFCVRCKTSHHYLHGCNH